MAADGVTCAGCGTEAPPGARFCGECGGRLDEPSAAPAEPAAAPSEPAVTEVEKRVAAPTLFSVPSPIGAPPSPSADQAEDEGNTTMVGVYAPSFPGYESAAREVLGASASHASAALAEPAVASQAPLTADRAPAPRPASPLHEPLRREASEPSPSGGHVSEPGPSGGYVSEPSPSGGYVSEPSPSGGYVSELSPSGGYATRGSRRRGARASRGARAERARKKKLVAIAAASLVGFVLVAGVLGLVRGGLGGEEVRVSLVNEGGVERLVVEVPEAEPGSRVRFDGEASPLEEGRTSFSLEPSDVRVGENVVNVEIVSPAGEVEAHQLTLSVPYRLRVDAAGLDEAPPVFRVRVDAVPGAIVLLDGQVVPLDAEGHGHRDFALDDEGGGNVERVVQHALRAPDGEEHHGRTTFVLPMAKLLIERPGTSTVTEESTLELAAAVHPEARVTLDGKPVENRGGRVVERLKLPSLGTARFELVATEEGTAPSRRVVEVRRVASLAREAERFVSDGPLEYTALAADPNAYRGRRVKLDGLAYHVETKDGKSDLQILARDCPAGQKCPIWVSYPGVVTTRPHSWVRVAGEISGAQRFRTVDTGRVVSVPRVDAAFVVQLSK